jgi:hypothetical protein
MEKSRPMVSKTEKAYCLRKVGLVLRPHLLMAQR